MLEEEATYILSKTNTTKVIEAIEKGRLAIDAWIDVDTIMPQIIEQTDVEKALDILFDYLVEKGVIDL